MVAVEEWKSIKLMKNPQFRMGNVEEHEKANLSRQRLPAEDRPGGRGV
jgi:hypothetical protein